MGVLRPLIARSQSVNKESDQQPSDRWVTPANAMTASRPVLGAIAAWMLMKGNRGATIVAGIAAATDMEGLAARAIDKWKPESGHGTSSKGKLFDPIADTAMLFELAAGALAAPKVSILGKVAIGIVGAQETIKAKQAVAMDREYKAVSGGQALDVPITLAGKEAMAEKMVAAGLAISTNEFESPLIRTGLGVASLGFAIAGALRGHSAHNQNMRVAQDMIEDARAESAEIIPFPAQVVPGA